MSDPHDHYSQLVQQALDAARVALEAQAGLDGYDADAATLRDVIRSLRHSQALGMPRVRRLCEQRRWEEAVAAARGDGFAEVLVAVEREQHEATEAPRVRGSLALGMKTVRLKG